MFSNRCPLQGIRQSAGYTAEIIEVPDQAPFGSTGFKHYLPIAAATHAALPEGRTHFPPTKSSIPERENHRIIESLRLEKTSKITKSNCQPNATTPRKKKFWRGRRDRVSERGRKYKGWNLGPFIVGVATSFSSFLGCSEQCLLSLCPFEEVAFHR